MIPTSLIFYGSRPVTVCELCLSFYETFKNVPFTAKGKKTISTTTVYSANKTQAATVFSKQWQQLWAIFKTLQEEKEKSSKESGNVIIIIIIIFRNAEVEWILWITNSSPPGRDNWETDLPTSGSVTRWATQQFSIKSYSSKANHFYDCLKDTWKS